MSSAPVSPLFSLASAFRASLCSLLVAGLLGMSAAHAQQKTPPRASTPEIAEKQADLGELRNRIEQMRKELSSTEDTRASAADRLRESERQISKLQRELHELGDQRQRLRRQLDELQTQSDSLSHTVAQQRAQLEKLLYRQYLRGNPDSLQLLLNGDDPNQMARDLHYMASIAGMRAELLQDMRRSLDRKKALLTDTRERGEELAEVEAEQRKRHQELEKQRNERRQLHAQISEKVRAQRREIGNLQRDERQLSQLINRLSKILAEQAAREAAREAARKKAAAAPPPAPRRDTTQTAPDEPATRPGRKPSELENTLEPVASSGSFARQRGQLRLPVRGAVSGRFGASREGGGTWRGLFIRAAAGQEVKAVANGRVVFAEWMRGFGNLLIIDHGDAYLSIYGNNDALLKQVGQSVRGGENIATVGNTGGNPESGLYFEIRHQGQPVDPLKWANLK